MRQTVLATFLSPSLGAVYCAQKPAVQEDVLNVSYDPKRELYEDFQQIFTPAQGRQGARMNVKHVTRRLGAQDRAVIDGLDGRP